MAGNVSHRLVEWTEAGIIDEQTAERIRAFERSRSGSARMRWPVLVALAFGALAVGAGVLLFVSAHWDALSPQSRFALVILLVSIFHVAGALTAERFPAMAVSLHAVGTVALGAGIYLAGQVFNLDEHWPGGLMLWALGAALAAALLRDAAQVGLVAMLAPAWLASEWFVATRELRIASSGDILACGLFLMALAYFTSAGHDRVGARRRVLVWVGGIALLPCALFLVAVGEESWWRSNLPSSRILITFGWTMALGIPLAVAGTFRRKDGWPIVVAAAWALALVLIVGPLTADAAVYVWWALAAVGLVAWGVYDSRPERINIGAVVFAGTLLAFYFSHVMDKLGRSISLVGLGAIFLLGGWALERVRRRLVQQVRGEP